jgi:hypothetical protein
MHCGKGNGKLGNVPVQGIMCILANTVPEKNADVLTGARDVQCEDLHPGHVARNFVRFEPRFDGMTLKPNRDRGGTRRKQREGDDCKLTR